MNILRSASNKRSAYSGVMRESCFILHVPTRSGISTVQIGSPMYGTRAYPLLRVRWS